MSRQPHDDSAASTKIQFYPKPRFYPATVEDEDLDDVNDDDYEVPDSFLQQEELPKIPKAQNYTSNRPRVESPRLDPVSMRTSSQAPPLRKRPSPHRRESNYGQPLVHHNGLQQERRDGSRVRPVEVITSRTSVPESIMSYPDLDYNDQYPPHPRRRQLPSPHRSWADNRGERNTEHQHQHSRRGSTYRRDEDVSDYRGWRGSDDEGTMRPRSPSPLPPPPPPEPPVIQGPTIERHVITHYRDIDHGVIRARPPSPPPILAHEPHIRADDIRYGTGDVTVSREENTVISDHVDTKNTDEEIMKMREKVVEAENRAAGQAREAETMRNEESARLFQEKVMKGIDEVTMLLKEIIHQKLETEKQTDRGSHAGRDHLQPEAAALPRHPPVSPAPYANPPRSIISLEDGESLPQPPPNVPEPPDVYAETETERPTTGFSASKMRRLWQLEQEERIRERRERKTLRTIWEELGFPMTEALAAGLAGASYGYARPAPPQPQFYKHYSPRSSRASGSRFQSTYRKFSSGPELFYSESESESNTDDATYTPRRYRQARNRPKSRGRPLPLRNRMGSIRHGAEISLPHRLPTERDDEDVFVQEDSSMQVEAEPRPAEITMKGEQQNGRETDGENFDDNAGEGSTEKETTDTMKLRALIRDHIVAFVANIVAFMPLRFWFDIALVEVSLRLGGALDGLMSASPK